MRAIFSGFFFIFSIYFTIQAFDYDYITNNGQVGPGFFPVWIGGLLVICTAIAFTRDIKLVIKQKKLFTKPTYLNTLLLLLGVTFLFIALLNLLGSVITMMLYIFAVLFILNRGRIVLNSIMSITIPIGTYLLLDTWLNAGLPTGIFGF